MTTVIKRLPCQTLSYEQLLPRLFYDDCYQQTSMPNIVLLTTVIKKLSCPCPMDNCYQETVMSECSMVDCCQKTFMLDIIVWTSVMKRLSCQAMSSKQRLSRDFYIRHCPMGNCYQETVMSDSIVWTKVIKRLSCQSVLWTTVIKRLSCQTLLCGQFLSRDFHARQCPLNNCYQETFMSDIVLRTTVIYLTVILLQPRNVCYVLP